MPTRRFRRPRDDAPGGDQDPLDFALAGFWTSQAVYALARLEVADRLGDGPATARDLAGDLDVDADRLDRVLRAAAAIGLLSSDGEAYRLTEVGRQLGKGGRRDEVIDQVQERYLRADDLLECLRTGRTAFHRRFGEEMFDYLQDHETERRLFSSAMTGMARHTVPQVVEALDLAGDELVVDVGGGEGSLAIALVKTYDDIEAIIFDRPQVAKQAKQRVQFGGLTDRCRVHDGDFFEGVPTGADLYLLARVLHDWDDDQARQILGNVAEALPDGGRVVVAEELVPPGDTWSPAKVKDLMMMVMTGGRERSAEEYRALMEDAGLGWAGVKETGGPLGLVEARAP